jgi:hypothetical protein
VADLRRSGRGWVAADASAGAGVGPTEVLRDAGRDWIRAEGGRVVVDGAELSGPGEAGGLMTRERRRVPGFVAVFGSDAACGSG